MENVSRDYCEFLKSVVDNIDLSGLKIVLDCANGATFKVAPKIYEELGATVFSIHDKPDGKNINDKCGSTHVESLQKKVVELGADIGFAFDGDGDRCFCVDEKGVVVEGDEILSIIGMDMKKNNSLKDNTIVATVMSNLGLSIMGEENKINILKTSVGDRYVLEEMNKNNYNLGGEQSGHIIMLDYNSTGDGILTSLQIAKILKNSNKLFSELNSYMEILPQALVNASVANNKKYLFEKDETIKIEVAKLTKKYDGKGRVLIRPSGTEALVRVMIEGKNKEEILLDANKLAQLIEERLV